MTVSGLANAPGTKPGTSRDERMLSSSEFASLFTVAQVSMATVTHSFSIVAQTQHWPSLTGAADTLLREKSGSCALQRAALVHPAHAGP